MHIKLLKKPSSCSKVLMGPTARKRIRINNIIVLLGSTIKKVYLDF